MRHARVLLCLAWFFLAAPAWAEKISGVVFHVIDGDTLLFHPRDFASRAFLKIRLADIDAPEMDQPFGEEARQALMKWVMGKEVTVVTVATDDYDRQVGWVRLGRLDLNRELVRGGYAWAFTRYHRNLPMIALERQARGARRGLWSRKDAVPPWKWRHGAR